LRGYNWRNALSDATAVSGILAGFAIAFIGLILQSQKDFLLGSLIYDNWSLTIYANSLGLLLAAFAAALFITSVELSLMAKTFDIWNIPKEYSAFLRKGFKKKWSEVCHDQDAHCKKYDNLSRHAYNCAIFSIFAAMGLTVTPYNLTAGILTTMMGWVAELIQMSLFRWKPPVG
jgi:hypothetical protein